MTFTSCPTAIFLWSPWDLFCHHILFQSAYFTRESKRCNVQPRIFFQNECPLKFCTSLLCSTIFQADIIDASFIRVLQTHIVLHTARKFQSMSISKRAMNHRWELAIAVLATDVAWAFLSFSYLLFFEYLYCRNHTLAMFDPTAWLWLAIFTNGHLNILWKTYLRITE